MKNLNLRCDDCGQKIQIEISNKDYRYYLTNQSFIEGWVAYKGIFCGGCKYEFVPFY